MKKTILLLLIVLSLASCQSDDAEIVNNTTNEPVAIQFEDVFKFEYAYTGNNAPSNHVLNDEAAWNDFAGIVNSPFNIDPETGETVNALMALSIDFSAYTVIAVSDERHSNGGHDITISSIVQEGNAITVSVETSAPGEGNVTAAETQPIHIVKIPKTTLPVTFDVN